MRTFPPQKLGPDDPGFPTHLQGPEVLPIADLEGKSPLTGDRALHVPWAFRGTVHHLRVIEQQRGTAARLPTGLVHTAGDDRDRSVLD